MASDMGNTYKILLWKILENGLLGRLLHEWWYNISFF